MSVSPFESQLLSGLLGDDEIAARFTARAELEAMLAFEVALAMAEADERVIPREAADHIATHLNRFSPDTEAIRAAAARDGVVGVEFVRQLREALGEAGHHVHVGATSQDVVDTALVLRLRGAIDILAGRLETGIDRLDELEHRFGSHQLMGRTRMQDAIPIRVGDRLASWRAPLVRHRQRLDQLAPRLLVLQFGGAAGTLDKLGDKGPAVAARLAERLGLGLPTRPWHTQRDGIVEFADWLSLVSGSLGKIGIDLGLMAQGDEILREGGGGSTAMPHKSNPVGGEVLVALARFNAALAGGMQGALVHEQERSGAAWTLEWLILPQMVMTTAVSLRTAAGVLGQITGIGRGPDAH